MITGKAGDFKQSYVSLNKKKNYFVLEEIWTKVLKIVLKSDIKIPNNLGSCTKKPKTTINQFKLKPFSKPQSNKTTKTHSPLSNVILF